MNKENIVYLRNLETYDELLNNKNFLSLLNKFVIKYKVMCNIITKKQIENYNIWILPIDNKSSEAKINKLIKKISENKVFVLSEELKNIKLLSKSNINYLKANKVKKILLLKQLEYVANIQKKLISEMQLIVLINEISDLNLYLIEEIALKVRNLKIVSKNINKFKKFEEKLYTEHGIAIQFSNSYKKSLSKGTIIANFDFNNVEINEYNIMNNAIIINCDQNDIQIKSKLFNGIVVNSLNIKFNNELYNVFKNNNLYEQYSSLLLYESIIYEEHNIFKIIESLSKDNVSINRLIGNNGSINKREIRSIAKRLDKY